MTPQGVRHLDGTDEVGELLNSTRRQNGNEGGASLGGLPTLEPVSAHTSSEEEMTATCAHLK